MEQLQLNTFFSLGQTSAGCSLAMAALCWEGRPRGWEVTNTYKTQLCFRVTECLGGYGGYGIRFDRNFLIFAARRQDTKAPRTLAGWLAGLEAVQGTPGAVQVYTAPWCVRDGLHDT